ncbi:hypothetical protein M3G03_09910 [Aestuariimicrobium sp. p3-SID1156]|uniref:hypothetical protein n=1 Tax=Aestuariimicrobium sp. p3-SID1156 TaxID=2916038 RepID=UPI00223C2A64|nr:hypothetical protein [Aestuariimicrobium sp. p3-SID1156]MCT1459845.1 hypothetical protein [Aestuariimicrobium sp. p3-SID1156]
MVQQNTVSRRAVAKGVAWSAPAVLATSAVPAFAASQQCTYTSEINPQGGPIVFNTPRGSISVPVVGSLEDGLTVRFGNATLDGNPIAVSSAEVTVSGFQYKNKNFYNQLTSTPVVSSTTLPTGVTAVSNKVTTTLTAGIGTTSPASAVLGYNSPGTVELGAVSYGKTSVLAIASVSITVGCA